MPAERKRISDLASFRYAPMKLVPAAKGDVSPSVLCRADSSPPESKINPIPETKTDYSSKCDVYYPLTLPEREKFRTKAGKRVPPHHWAVYDLVRTIPVGKVSTYKDVCAALGAGSPRSVGGALRNNPFAPRIPCHRVIASSLFVGGFKGEWVRRECDDGAGDDDEGGVGKENWHWPFRGGGMGPLQNEKVWMLVREGVGFAMDGKVVVSRDAVWQFDD